MTWSQFIRAVLCGGMINALTLNALGVPHNNYGQFCQIVSGGLIVVACLLPELVKAKKVEGHETP